VRFFGLVLFFSITLASSLPLWSQSGDVFVLEPRFEPQRLAVGDIGRLIVTLRIEGQGPSTFPDLRRLPSPEGLGLNFVRRSERFSSSGWGNAQREVIYEFQVSPLDGGTFTLPEREWEEAGNKFRLTSATIEVTGDAESFADRQRRWFFLEWEIGREQLFVGEVVSGFLHLTVSTEVPQLQYEFPTLRADNWDIRGLNREPARSQIDIEGNRYHRLTWAVVLTPLRSGAIDLGANIQIVAVVPEDASTRAFGNSFFQQRRLFSLETPSRSFPVRPIPQSGRPASFTGAVGDFQVSFTLDQKEVTEGDPVVLEMAVTGRGNFDRVLAPEVIQSSEWRTLGAESSFEAVDAFNTRGSKTFRYVWIPLIANEDGLPVPAFSFFDPIQETFVEFVNDPFPVRVNPAARPESPFTGEPSAPVAPLLLSLLERTERTPASTRIDQLVRHPVFWASQGALFLGFAGFTLLARHQKRLKSDAPFRLRWESRRRLRRLWREWALLPATKTEDRSQLLSQMIRTGLEPIVGRRLDSALASEITKDPEFLRLPAPLQADVETFFQRFEAERYRRIVQSDQLPSTEEIKQILRRLHAQI
jgi:hypothetical protein